MSDNFDPTQDEKPRLTSLDERLIREEFDPNLSTESLPPLSNEEKIRLAELAKPGPAHEEAIPVLPGPGSASAVSWENREWPVVRGCSWTEDEYVDHELRVTQARRANSDRLMRSERYLRWRYRGFLAGQISSL